VSGGPYATLNLGASVGDSPECIAENRRRFAAVVGAEPHRVLGASQVHGNRVVRIDRLPDSGEPAPEADALMTNQPGIFLRLLFADCVPILVAAPRRGAVGVAHGGWRGTRDGVARELVRAIGHAYDVPPADLRAVVGPSIGPCCYAVGPEVVRSFQAGWPDASAYVRVTALEPVVDLWEANRRQLVGAGLAEENVLVSGACTRCRGAEFFSHRGQGGRAGRFGALIGLAGAAAGRGAP
jgi:YfiH family protein